MRFKRLCLGLTGLILLCSVSLSSGSTLSEWLRSYLTGFYDYKKIRIVRIVSSRPLPEGIPEEVSVEELLPARATLLLHYREMGPVRINVQIKGYEGVVLVKRPLRKGQTIQRSDLYLGVLEADRLPPDAIHSIDEAIGKISLRSLGVNVILRRSMLINGPLVKKGRPVLIVLETPTFRITSPGRLNETASVGELVRVINLSTKKTLRGVLVDENTVKIWP